MAKVFIGTITSTGAAYNLDLGFRPSRIVVENYSNYATPVNGEILRCEWFDGMADAYAFKWTYDNTGGALGTLATLATTNGFTPYETADASLFEDTRITVTDITAAAQAVVTAATHGLAVDDVVTFSGVLGMSEINFLRGKVTSVPDANHVWVNIDSTGFTAYTSAGSMNLISGTTVNDGATGITLGTDVVGANTDVLYYTAYLDTPTS